MKDSWDKGNGCTNSPTDKIKYELINPSDKIFLEGDFKTACIVALVLGNGWYALADENGKSVMPIRPSKEWLEQNLHPDGFVGALNDTPVQQLYDCFNSVKCAGEVSSLNDIQASARKHAFQFKHILDEQKEKGAAKEKEIVGEKL